MFSKASKIGIILLLPFIFELVSCCDRDCLPSSFLQYTNCSISVENLDNSGPTAVVSNAITINKNAFGIKLNINRQINICEAQTHFSFFPSAYAYTSCHCDPPYYFDGIEFINSIEVITLNDFNQNNVSGANITSMFKVFDEKNIFDDSEFVAVNDYLLPTGGHRYDHDILNIELNLLLFATDVYNVNQQFEVRVKLSDGRTLSSTTQIVVLN